MKLLAVVSSIFLMVFTMCPDGIAGGKIPMIDIQKTTQRLQDHLTTLTRTIGERSVFLPQNIEKTKD
ncbi:MAG: hypothetical protein WBI57_10825, partial [Desulfobacterales bacterium]